MSQIEDDWGTMADEAALRDAVATKPHQRGRP